MATFPDVLPTYSTVEDTKQNSQRIKFADGYEQRLVMGLPTNKRLISLIILMPFLHSVKRIRLSYKQFLS